jgi:hypothetical protein
MDDKILKAVKNVMEELTNITLEKLNNLKQEFPDLDKKRLRVLPFRLDYIDNSYQNLVGWKNSNQNLDLKQNQVLVKDVRKTGKKKPAV